MNENNDIDYEDTEIQLRLKSCLAILRRRRMTALTTGDTIEEGDNQTLPDYLPTAIAGVSSYSSE